MISTPRSPSLVSSSPFLLLLVGLAAPGCKDRLYDFGVGVIPVDGSVTHVDASFERPTMGGSGGRGGTSGGRGGGGGTGGTGVAGSGGTGGGVSTCSDTSPDRQTDVSNCGVCFRSCLVPNSNPACVAGQCRFSCFANFYDADGVATNGCECTRTNGGVEACDGIDNDCDGTVDEGFDFMGSLVHCGGCNRACSFPFANASCANGVCSMGACLAGFYDRDPAVPGCETACTRTNGGVEICDGLDNDCNGVVDNNPQPSIVPCRSGGVCASVQPTCMGQAGWVCVYPSTFQDVEDMTRGCDSLDNDCDTRTDEAFQIGQPCTVGSGACSGTGSWVCDNSQTGNRRCMGSPRPPGTETCNGLDDDCDGKVDELDRMADRTTDDRLVYFAAQNVTIFAHEASRYDASGTNYGFDSTRRPCSVAGKQPWSNVTKEEAQTACARIGTGWRLCTAAEWVDACNGSGNTNFPYGASYINNRCVGDDYPKAAGQTTLATGAASMCVSDLSTATGDELFDMSGNVREWVLNTTDTAGPFQLRGGSYNTPSFIDNSVNPAVRRAPGLQCSATVPAPVAQVKLPSVGFRCCRTGMLPP
jgi:hypothetical protein